MSGFEWNDRYQLDVAAMDAEHKHLLKLMARLESLAASGASKAAMRTAMRAFVDYTVQHFREEEEFMASIGYSQLETHKKLHARLLAKVSECSDAFEAGAPGWLPEFPEGLGLRTHLRDRHPVCPTLASRLRRDRIP